MIRESRCTQRDTYHTSQQRQSSENDAGKRERHNNGRILRIRLEDVMDLWTLAVSLDLDRWNGLVRVASDRQPEGDVIVGLRAAKRSDQESRVDGFGGGLELDREILVRLGHQLLRPVMMRGHVPNPIATSHCLWH